METNPVGDGAGVGYLRRLRVVLLGQTGSGLARRRDTALAYGPPDARPTRATLGCTRSLDVCSEKSLSGTFRRTDERKQSFARAAAVGLAVDHSGKASANHTPGYRRKIKWTTHFVSLALPCARACVQPGGNTL